MHTSTTPTATPTELWISSEAPARTEQCSSRRFFTDEPYLTPDGAQHRTFHAQMNRPFDAWALFTFTAWALEDVWLTPPIPFIEQRVKATLRSDTALPHEVRWLLRHVFGFEGAQVLRFELEAPTDAAAEPRAEFLASLLAVVHLFLDQYDVPRLVDALPALPASTREEVCAQRPSTDLEAIASYLRACFQCVELAYYHDETFARASKAAPAEPADALPQAVQAATATTKTSRPSSDVSDSTASAPYLTAQDDAYQKHRLPYVTTPGTAHRTFQFRVEFDHDLLQLRAMLGWATETWWSSPICPWGDADAKFTLKPNTLSLDELRWLFAQVGDCHVAMETIELTENYTGERRYMDEYELGAVCPSRASLHHAVGGLYDYIESLELTAERASDAVNAMRKHMEPFNGAARYA